MRRWARKHRFLRWGGLVVCLIFLAVYAASGFVTVYWRPSGVVLWGDCGNGSMGMVRDLIFANGCLFVYWVDPYDGQPPFLITPADERGIDLLPSAGSDAVPLWPLFPVVAVPTVVLWWPFRRFPPAHCQRCGYNLTGNVSGTCPECGASVK